MLRTLFLVIVTFGIAVGASPARAQVAHRATTGATNIAPPGLAAPKRTPTRTIPYGWQILAVDAAAISAMATGADGLSGLGLGVAFFGAPIVHWSHGRPGTAVASLGLRVAGTVGGGLIGAAAATDGDVGEDSIDKFVGGVLGASLGFLGAAIIDATVLAHEPVREPTVTPTLSIQPGGGSVGFRLRF